MLGGMLGVRAYFLKGIGLEQGQQPLAGAHQSLGVPFLEFVFAAAR